ncbi:MAG: ATP-binding cassette domain-containing protein, partial [Anaerolineae bacterium]|nr:ATP-binding cassette domain-containing protein [Anaerolineae bacterium]
ELAGLFVDDNEGLPAVEAVSLKIRGGEILGIAGVSGNGQKELAEVIAGLRTATSGSVSVHGTDITNGEPAKIKAMGLSYIPEERMVDGIIKDFSVAENYILRDCTEAKYATNGLFMRFNRINKNCEEAIRAYAIKTPDTATKAKSLSGGNIQKLVLARELSSDPEIILASQPTRGVDIGAIEYIHHRLLEEREKGRAILLISEDLDEILLLADRILVIYEGKFVGEVPREKVVIEEIGKMMAGSGQHDMA